MRSLKRQAGYGSLLMLALMGILAVGSTVYYKTRMQQPESVRETYESTAEELRQISSALTDYYRDNMAWPATINELAAGGYFSGDAARCGGGGAFQSPFCTAIFGGQVGDNYTLTVNLLKESVAQAVANQIPGGSAAGTTVTATINRPFQSALYEDYLQRVEDPDNPQRTQLEIDLDINNNDLVNIDSFNAQRATFDNASITNANIERLNTEEVQLGNNSIDYNGNQLNINAGTVRVNGTLSMSGDVVGNGNDITGIDTVSANTGDFDSISADSATINSLNGNSLDYNSGSIDSLSGNTLAFGSGTVGTLSGNTFTFNSGAISSVSGSSLDFNNGNIGSLGGNTLSFNSGTINSLSGDNASFTSVNGTNGNFNSVSASSGNIGNMNVSGTSGFNRLTASNGNVTNLDVNAGSINSGEANSASGTSVSSSGTSTFNDLDSNSIDTNSFSGQTVNASSGSVSGNASVGSLSVSNLTVSNTLQTNVIESNTSSVGNASSTALNVLGELSAAGINVTTANFNSGNIANVSGTTANYNSISSNQFNGGSFNSNDDFYTPQSSVNNNYLLITEQRNKLDHCMDVTQYCIPQTPAVDVSCPSCNSAAARSNFSGTATGTITDCRQGCSYSWVTSGSGLNFSGCASGTVPKGGSATPSCSVSASLGPQESASGSIQLVVTNSHYTSRTASDSVNVSYTNTTPNNPFLSVTAGCYIDTPAYDEASAGGCRRSSFPQEQNIDFSVGDYLNGRFHFSNSGEWSISWSGACSGSRNYCNITEDPKFDTEWTATATVRHIPTGQTRNYSVTARFFSLN